MPEKIKIDSSSFSKIGLKKNSHYFNGRFNYPNTNILPINKGREYHKGWAEKIYELFINSKGWMSRTDYGSIDIMRLYADGRQPTIQYKDWILGSWGIKGDTQSQDVISEEGWDMRNPAGADFRRKAWINIPDRPVSVAPKIMAKVNEHIRSLYYELSVKAIDSFSVENEELAKYRLWFEKQEREWLRSMSELVGVQEEEPIFVPENLDELELYAANGGFKVPYAISMEDLLRHSFDISDWDKEVREKIIRDLLTIGYAIVKEDYDPELKRVVVKYRDPKDNGVQFSKENSFKNAEFAYGLEWWEISRIRQRLNLTQEEAAALAFSYSGEFGNPSSDDWDKYGYQGGVGGGYGFDFYKVPVFHFEFVDIDNEQYITVINSHGRIVNKPYNGELQANETLKNHQRRTVREGRWIVGTDHLFDWGERQYVPRNEFNQPRISYRAVKINTAPVIEQIRPFLDGFTLSHIKLQDAIAKAVGNGFAVDVGVLKDISVGKDRSFDPLEVLNYYRQSSFLLYKRVKQGLSGIAKVSQPPVIPLSNNTYDNIKAQFESMNFFMTLIEEVSGLNMTAMGKSADPHVAKFNMQVSLQGTNDIINNIARCTTDIQEDVAVNVCYRIRSLCRTNEDIHNSYNDVIGSRRMKAVVDAEKNHVRYGIKIEATDVTEQKQVILTMLSSAIKQPGSEEYGKLDMSEALLIQDMIMQGQNLRRIGLILGYKLRRKEREAIMIKQRNIELQGEQLQRPEMVKYQAQKEAQDFEMAKLEKEYFYKYMVKWGVPPGQQPLEQPIGNTSE